MKPATFTTIALAMAAALPSAVDALPPGQRVIALGLGMLLVYILGVYVPVPGSGKPKAPKASEPPPEPPKVA
jgi:hypothetical protein